MDNEFSRDYGNEIALECDKLDKILFVALEEYNNTGLQLGSTKWYSIALEDNDSNKEKNSEAKRNVLLRVIDKVVEFIKMVGKKIAEWYKACRDAIVKFFAKEDIDPVKVAARFDLLVEDFPTDHVTKLIAQLSKENKHHLAEILHPEYNKAFNDVYENFSKIAEKANGVGKFSSNHSFFEDFVNQSGELKSIASKGNIYDKVDDSLRKLLSSSASATAIKDVTNNFNAIGAIQKRNVEQLEKLLKQIPDDDMGSGDGDNVDAKRQEAVKMISDVIKVNSEVVLKANNYMQAVAVLMSSIVKYRSRQVIYLPV